MKAVPYAVSKIYTYISLLDRSEGSNKRYGFHKRYGNNLIRIKTKKFIYRIRRYLAV